MIRPRSSAPSQAAKVTPVLVCPSLGTSPCSLPREMKSRQGCGKLHTGLNYERGIGGLIMRSGMASADTSGAPRSTVEDIGGSSSLTVGKPVGVENVCLLPSSPHGESLYPPHKAHWALACSICCPAGVKKKASNYPTSP